MNWLWPRRRNDDSTWVVRVARLLHWAAIGLAILFATMTVVAGVQQQVAEPIFYVGAILIWFAFAMLGRGLRYLIARE